MKKPVSICLLLLLMACLLPAQDQLALEEMFHWFPAGKYLEIEHTALEKLKASSAFTSFLKKSKQPVHKWLNDNLSCNPLPPWTLEQCYSFTYLRRAKMHISYDEDVGNRKNYNFTINYNNRDVSIRAELSKLIVYRFDDVSPAWKKLVKRGLLIPVETKPVETPVFKFEQNKNTAWYLCRTIDNSILISDTKRSLQDMIAAGQGSGTNISEKYPFPWLINNSFERGFLWKAKTIKPYFEAIMKKTTESADDEMLEMLITLNNMKMNRDKFTGFVIGTEVEKRAGNIWKNEKIAEKKHSENKFDKRDGCLIYSVTLLNQAFVDKAFLENKYQKKEKRPNRTEK